MARTTTLSSLGVSTAIILNSVHKVTTLQVTTSSSAGSGVVDVQMTLDDPTTTPAPSLNWTLLSSAAAIPTGASGLFDSGGLFYTVVTPIGGVRLHSTANATPVTVTLKALSLQNA